MPSDRVRYSIVKQPPASLFEQRRARAYELQTRVIAPGLVRLQGSPVVCCLSDPKGRAERLGETPRPRRPHCCGQPYAFRHTAPMRLSAHGQVQLISEPDRPQNTGVACVPHANGFFGLLHVPRNCRSRRHVPGSCKLLPGHALGPSARLVGVNCLSVYGSPTSARNPQTFRPDLAAATASRSTLW